MSPFDETEERFLAARSRVEYRLTFGKCEPRRFESDVLLGPDIPDAFGEGMSPGEWSCEDAPSTSDPEVPEEDWFAQFAHMAVAEAVHEALEWFKVDGVPWLDPHGTQKLDIHHHVRKLVEEFVHLRGLQQKEES